MPPSMPHPCRAVPRRARPALGVLAFLAVLVPAALPAQQFGVDDAALARFPGCQLEAWRAETETRLEPACTLIPDLEILLGFELDPDLRDRVRGYTVEFKARVLPVRPGGVGVAVLAGLDYDPRPDDSGGEVSTLFAFVPVTLSIGDDRLQLHTNVGWRYGFGAGDADHHRTHAPIFGVRADLELPGLDERFLLIGDLLSDDRERPRYQLGLRTRVVPDRLVVDVSWGGHTAPGERGKGWIFGFGWTPPALQ